MKVKLWNCESCRQCGGILSREMPKCPNCEEGMCDLTHFVYWFLSRT